MSASNDPKPIFLRLPDVQRVLGIGRSTVYNNLAADPTFPRPVKLGKRAVGWRRTEIEAWAEQLQPSSGLGG